MINFSVSVTVAKIAVSFSLMTVGLTKAFVSNTAVSVDVANVFARVAAISVVVNSATFNASADAADGVAKLI